MIWETEDYCELKKEAEDRIYQSNIMKKSKFSSIVHWPANKQHNNINNIKIITTF